MHRSLDHSCASPQPPLATRAPAPSSCDPDAGPSPAREAPLVLPRDWELLDLDQRVRTVGEW